jgi:hypothetical protein
MRSLGVGGAPETTAMRSANSLEIHIKLYGLDLPTHRGTSYYQH